MKLYQAILLLFIFVQTTKSQTLIGYLVDEKGNPVSLASVEIIELNKSSFSDQKGRFEFNSIEGKYSLKISNTGFETSTNVIQINSDTLITFTLNPNIVKIDVVEIQSKKLTISMIMDSVAMHRSKNLEIRKNFSASSFLKFTLWEQENNLHDSNFLLERESKIIQRELEFQETVLKEKIWTQNAPESKFSENRIGPFSGSNRFFQKINPTIYGINWEDLQFNWYKSWVLLPGIGESPYVSPCSDLANLYYKFEVISTSLNAQNTIVYKIKIIPRSENQQTIMGEIDVEAKNWQIVETNFKIRQLKHFEYLEIKQVYNLFDSTGVLLLSNLNLKYGVKKGGGNMEGKVEQQISNYTLGVNPNINFGNEIRTYLNSEIKLKYILDSNLSTPPLQFNYSKNELSLIKKSDSLKIVWESDDYQNQLDSIGNRITLSDVFIKGIDKYNHKKGYKFLIDPLLQQMNFFGVGGYRHLLGGKFMKNFKKGHELSFAAQLDYGFNTKDLKGSSEITYLYLPKKFAYFKLGGGSKYQLLTYTQNIAALFSRNNYVLNDYIELAHGIELINGVFLDLNAKFLKRSTIKDVNLSDFENNLFGNNNNIPLDFEDYSEMNLKVKLDYTPFQRYEKQKNRKIILGSKWPTFIILSEQGIPKIEKSTIHYHKIEFGINQTIKFKSLGTGKFAVKTGKFLFINNAYYPNFQFFRGTDNYLFSNPLTSFQLLGPTLSTFDQYLDVHYVHHFQELLTKKIPFVNKAKLETVAGISALWLSQNNFKHTEIFVGLELPIKAANNKYKFGVYYVAATSSISTINHQIKIGLNIYNNFTRQWLY